MRVVRIYAGGLAWLALVIVGCHAPPAMKSTKCVCTPNGPCGGYFSTCWRQWPAECTSCPPMTEPSDVPQPAAPPGANETVPPPPPRLHDVPDDLPPAMLDEPETQSGSRPRRRPSAGTSRAATTRERPRGPQTITPHRPVKVASPQSDEPVVYRRTTVELLPPTDSEAKGRLLVPPSYSGPK